ncbi:MAG: trypsin-like peptidase domain-containing protein [Proteobacteria bacterium]|nr:trypsin-like peptidase domain-containing protein [Pseudomonadota bacterium]
MSRISYIVLALCIAFITPASGTESGSLIRLTDREDLFGWEAVGRIDVAKAGYCTGVLIANDLVLTAAHCVFSPKTGQLYAPEKFTFRAGLRDGKTIETLKGLRVVADKTYDPRYGTSQRNIRHDVALIQLNGTITSFAASPFRLHTGATKGKQVSVVSYGQGRDDALSWQRKCKVLARDNGLMAFDCNVTFGSSGAPVFAKEGNHTRILSLISSGGKSDGKTISFGMDLPKVVKQLKKDLVNAPASKLKRPVSKVRMMSVGDGKKTSGAKFIKN